MKHVFFYSILLLFALGIFLRFYSLQTIPAMHLDEMSYAYTAYSFAKTGVDEFRKAPGIVFESLGDYKFSLFAYFVMPFVSIIGLSPLSVRLPSALLGLASVLLFYFLFLRLTKNKIVTLISTLLFLLSPWHIVFSRTGNESSLQLFLLLSGLLSWLIFNDKKQRRFYLLSVISFVACLYSYYSSLVFLPLLLLLLPLLKNRDDYSLQHIIPFVTVGFFLLIFVLTQPMQRLSQLSIFNHGEVQALSSEAISEDHGALPLFVTRLLHNKVIVTGQLLVRNYFAHYNYDFLFGASNTNYDRYTIPGMGPLYGWMLVFILGGLIVSVYRVFKYRDRINLFLIWWLVVSFIPGAYSYEGTNIQRAIMALPVLTYFCGLGIYVLFNYIANNTYNSSLEWIFIVVLGVIGMANIIYFYDAYFIRLKVHRPWYRQPYAAEYMRKLHMLAKKYPVTVVARDPYIIYLFYDKVPPVEAQKMLAQKAKLASGVNVIERYRSLVLMPLDCPKAGKLNVLYVCNGDSVPLNSTIVDIVRYPDNIPAKVFITFTPINLSSNTNKGDRIKIIEDTIKEQKILPDSYPSFW